MQGTKELVSFTKSHKIPQICQFTSFGVALMLREASSDVTLSNIRENIKIKNLSRFTHNSVSHILECNLTLKDKVAIRSFTSKYFGPIHDVIKENFNVSGN